MEEGSKNSEYTILTLEQIKTLLEDKDTSPIAELYGRGKLTKCMSLGEKVLQKDIPESKKELIRKIISRCKEHLEKDFDKKSLIPKINKLAEPKDLTQISIRAISMYLTLTKSLLEHLKLPYSSHMADSWLRHWEYSNAIIFSQTESWMRILDAGGTGTIFSYLLALLGCQTYTVDIDESKIKSAIFTSEKLGLKNIFHLKQDIRQLEFPDNFFDRVFSISVIEHLEPETLGKAVKELARVLKPGGILTITFDYGNYYGEKFTPGSIKSPSDLKRRIIDESGLEILYNPSIEVEVELQPLLPYESMEYIFGIIILKKPGEEKRPEIVDLSWFATKRIFGTIDGTVTLKL
ncbi:Ubiquinone biosynthesis O-methyltransferase [bacterium HR19]|nr:Ubiquinone biosynthesis O-methyltransferase [bacterium HR19]